MHLFRARQLGRLLMTQRVILLGISGDNSLTAHGDERVEA
jgi:hypothetical protein